MLESRSADPARFDAEFAAFQPRQAPWDANALPAGHWLRMLRFPYPAAREYFLLKDGNKTLGRIGASRSALHPERGFVGFFEVDLTHPGAGANAGQLLEAATAWLRSQGVQEIAGPVDLSTWFNYRFQLAPTGARSRLFAWEPVNPPEYPAFFEAFGMKPIHRYHSIGIGTDPATGYPPGFESTRRAHEAAVAAGYRFRELAPERDLPILHALSQRGFEEGFLFEPIGLEAFRSLYAPALERFDFSPSRIVENPAGEAVGFLFALVDGRSLVIKTVAVLPEERGKHLSTAVLYPAILECPRRGLTELLSALVKAGAGSEHHERRHVEAAGMLWRHDYVLFGMKL